MTVPSNVIRNQYNGNGATTAFTFTGKLLDQSHVKVVTLDTTDSGANPAGVTKVITTDYTVSGVGGSSATVTFLVAPPTGTRVTLFYNVPLTQTADYTANDPFPAETHEGALDKLTTITQQQQDLISRSALFPSTSLSSLVPILPPVPVDGYAIVWDGVTGKMKNGADLSSISAAIAATAADVVLTHADVVLTHADVVLTHADVVTTHADVVTANAAAAAAQAAVGGVRISSDDTTADKLINKLLAGANVTLTKNNAGGNETLTVAASGISPGYVSGRYYSGGIFTVNGSTVAVTANRLYAYPFFVSQAQIFTKIGLFVSTFAAGSARLGIYKMVNGLPATLVLDAGTVNTGTNGEKAIAISQNLAAGAYALVCVFNATPIILAGGTYYGSGATEFWGLPNGATDGQSLYAYTALTYGGLPSPWSGALTYDGTTNVLPSMWLVP